jgi:hypothetical protein
MLKTPWRRRVSAKFSDPLFCGCRDGSLDIGEMNKLVHPALQGEAHQVFALQVLDHSGNIKFPHPFGHHPGQSLGLREEAFQENLLSLLVFLYQESQFPLLFEETLELLVESFLRPLRFGVFGGIVSGPQEGLDQMKDEVGQLRLEVFEGWVPFRRMLTWVILLESVAVMVVPKGIKNSESTLPFMRGGNRFFNCLNLFPLICIGCFEFFFKNRGKSFILNLIWRTQGRSRGQVLIIFSLLVIILY